MGDKADQCMFSMADHDAADDSKVPICVEICLTPTSTANARDVKQAVQQYLSTKSLWYREGPIPLPSEDEEDPYLDAHVSSLTITDIDKQKGAAGPLIGSMLLFWQVQLTLVVYQLNEDEAADDDEGEDGVASYRQVQYA